MKINGLFIAAMTVQFISLCVFATLRILTWKHRQQKQQHKKGKE